MKKLFLPLLLAVMATAARAQGVPYNTDAIYILDRMSEVIGDLNACSYTLITAVDVSDLDHGLIKEHGVSEVYMVGPNKMLVDNHNHKGHRLFTYNGSQMALYYYDENNYGVVEAPPTIMETIAQINEDYGIDFPAADFFYPTFTDDLIEHSEQIRLLGKATIDGAECFHILATSKEMKVEIWVANDAFMLPKKFVITYATENHPQYAATFSKWAVNPDLPEAMFEFLPPAGASQVRVIPRNPK